MAREPKETAEKKLEVGGSTDESISNPGGRPARRRKDDKRDATSNTDRIQKDREKYRQELATDAPYPEARYDEK